jgi:hypothetical protein
MYTLATIVFVGSILAVFFLIVSIPEQVKRPKEFNPKPKIVEQSKLELRREMRTPVENVLLKVIDKSMGDSYNAIVRDISRSGIGLYCDTMLMRGVSYDLELETGEKVSAVVKHISKVDNMYVHGCQFATQSRGFLSKFGV